MYFALLHFKPIGPFLFMLPFHFFFFFWMWFIFWISEATGDEECDRCAQLTSWIFFSDFFFFRLLIGKELTLVRLIWVREDFFTRWRLIPGLSSNLWPEHQLKIQRVTRVCQSVSKQVSSQQSSWEESVRVLFTGHLNKSHIMFSTRNALHHGSQLESGEEHSVSERGPWVPVDLCYKTLFPAIIHSRNPLTLCYFTSIEPTVSREKIWITWYSIQWGN